MQYLLNLEMFKIYTRIHKYRSYMFRSSAIIRGLVLSLAKVMLEHLRPYTLCGGVAACLGVACVLCVVQNETELGCVYLKCGFMKYCTEITKFDFFYNKNHKENSANGPLKVLMKYSFGTFNLKLLYYVHR
jgi:hypothetical protein